MTDNKKTKNTAKKKKFRNPLAVILTVLLVFLGIGVTFAGCLHLSHDKIIVAVDAAYGGEQNGYTGIVNEAEFNEGVVNALCARLADDDRFIVLRTHEAGTSRAILNIVREINESKADLVLSIHAGYDPDPQKTGMHIYAEQPASDNHERSLELAHSIQETFADDLSAEVNYMYYEPIGEDRYQMKVVGENDKNDYELATWTIMEKTLVPAVVTEQIYVSNEADVSAWANEEGYKKTAELYYRALCRYYGIDQRAAKPKN